MRLPLEIPLIALALLFFPRPGAKLLSILFALVVFTLLFLKLADYGAQAALQRDVNPYLDFHLIRNGWNFASGAFGRIAAGLGIAAVLGLFLSLFASFVWAQRQISDFPSPRRNLAIGIVTVLLALGLALWAIGPGGLAPGNAHARTYDYLDRRLTLITRSIVDLHSFETTLESRSDVASRPDLFQAIKGRDVVLIFVESYGRSAVEDPAYAGLIRPRLARAEAQLAQAGFSSATTWLTSPTVGGMSWLAHGTLLSGLNVDSQARYDLLMRSTRPSLNRIFADAGWQTSAVMPAITMEWPEAAYFGYDQIFASDDLGYRGKPFNWVTMPDQYTLSAFETRVRRLAHARSQAVMSEIALISSHAPWTPIPELIDWQHVGDGTIFNSQAERGDPPAVVWSDPARVQRQYIKAVDYSLQTIADYIARFGEDAIFIVLGDHQPAAIITGLHASRAVPLHIISQDKALVDRFQSTGFTSGMTPDRDTPEHPMHSMRDRLITAFSKNGEPETLNAESEAE
ncbi:sulfatase [Roseibium sp. CAU 1637]|uniref:Sulfatase n=1 Tax=Roseibium limicola TaxID=2816037 RepID=A0A939EJR3_9HYPH|nr:sulfatase [Roseibium limicola]MBO0343930.1 sulfatase [Roseibium limicola]